jgi:hypothetical protein
MQSRVKNSFGALLQIATTFISQLVIVAHLPFTVQVQATGCQRVTQRFTM